ncbi:MAG: alginate export family protein [Gemmatimonadota bacterium]
MKRYWMFAVAVLILLGMLPPPAFAAEAPKVTVSGAYYFMTSWSKNIVDTTYTNDETLWMSHPRGLTTITGQVGKAKAVTSFEMDFAIGKLPETGIGAGLGGGIDLGFDEKEEIEVKWLYLEFPFTGPGSLLPMIGVPTTARVGGQPFSGHDFKRVLAVDQFGGLNFVTAVAPNVKNTFTYVQSEEGGESLNTAPDSFAILDSVQFSPQKGVTVKPTFAYYFNERDTGTAATTETTFLGAEIKWSEGPFSLEPSFFYQWGESRTPGSADLDINAWIFDVIAGWRQGPLKLGGRFVFTPGDKPNDPVGDDIDFWSDIWNSSTYWAGWSQIFTTGIDFYRQLNGTGSSFGWNAGGVNHGRIGAAAKADYAVTPALSLTGVLHGFWTAEDVDTTGNGIGDENLVGTEVAAWLTWKFAPRLTLYTGYAHLFPGDALDSATASADGVDMWSTRLFFSF